MMNQNLIKGLAVAAIWCSSTLVLQAAQDNIAPRAHVTVSNVLNENYAAGNLVDGKIMYGDKGEWACKGSVTSWGVMYTPWAQLEWDEEVCVDRVVLYDRVSLAEHLAGGTLQFSDGSQLSVTAIPNDGSPKSISFPKKKVKWIRFEATDGNGKNLG